ncbi:MULTISPECIES: hypothetical protein [unclassified Massilia]|uniref:hypothetical protein n=1 Tax=unclassified Massilia TaxID=2609279 RepID=UPI001782F22E|nr:MULTISPECIES: hypothetical protein [unclassified Massilia]MBD8531013.1 hypothetical protein [Massilia sp. CFBP 13647]MBD8674713.1 hypothetical protein [Massilia sp. CFBP 13721]
MPISLAQAALKYAKACVPNGPNNQGAGQLSAVKAWNPPRDPATRLSATIAVNALKLVAPARNCTMADIVAYGRQVSSKKAGNCLEQCAAACVYLSGSSELPQFRLVCLEAPADHIFLVLDQLPDGLGYFPDNFANWNPNAVVIDPWVSICCPAQDYPMWWKMKLDVMAAGGEELAGAGGWAKANDAAWKTAPTAHRKLSYTV